MCVKVCTGACDHIRLAMGISRNRNEDNIRYTRTRVDCRVAMLQNNLYLDSNQHNNYHFSPLFGQH